MRELGETLTQLLDVFDTPPGSGLVVTEAEVDFPLEVTAATSGGRLVFFGSAPHTRWVSGFLPDVNMARLRVALDSEIDIEAEAQCGR
jgi:hypothetical protein